MFKNIIILLSIFLFFVEVLDVSLIVVFAVVLLVCIFFSFYKKQLNVDLHQNIKWNLILSPVNGNVKTVKHNIHFQSEYTYSLIELVVPIYLDFTLLLPFNCDLLDLEKKKRSLLLFRSFFQDRLKVLVFPKLVLKMELINRRISYLLIKPKISLFPSTIWMQVGDRGSRGALFGRMLFGGRFLLYLPNDLRVIVQEGDQVLAGQTIIAEIS